MLEIHRVTVPAPTRVVRLVTRLNIGGPARQALFLSRALEPEFSTVLAAGLPGASEGELSDPAVAVARVPFVRPVDPRADARALLAARRLLQRERPALVHTHMAKAGAIGRLAAWSVRPRPRTVHTFDGHVLDGYFSRPVEQAFVAAERLLALGTDAIVAVSPQTRDTLLGLGIGRPEQFHVIPHGVDLEPFLRVTGPTGRLRRHLGIGPGTPLVGVVGRLVPIKEVGTVLEAAARLPGAHLAVIGDGEDRQALEAQAAGVGLGGRAHFLGWWDDIPGAMADLDVVALTSRNEGTPLSLIEASGAGRPVVASDVGGVRFVVDAGRSGFVVPHGDLGQLVSRISQLLGDPVLRQRMGEAGRRHVRDRFDNARMRADMARLYADLLRGPGRPTDRGTS